MKQITSEHKKTNSSKSRVSFAEENDVNDDHEEFKNDYGSENSNEEDLNNRQ